MATTPPINNRTVKTREGRKQDLVLGILLAWPILGAKSCLGILLATFSKSWNLACYFWAILEAYKI